MSREKRSHGRTTVRLRDLDEMIRNGRCRSAAQAAAVLGVKPRTIMRDIELLRDRHRAPIEYDLQAKRWRYTNKSFVLPGIQMSEGELVAVFLAERLMEQYRGAPFEPQLKRAFEKITEWLPEQVTVDLSAQGQTYSFEIGPVTEIDPGLVEAIGRAVSERRRLEITYYTQSRSEETVRRIDPYHVHNHRGEWYVIAYDHLRQGERDFHLGRIRSFRETETRFTVRPGFDLADHLKSGFDMVRGGEQHVVEIEFDAYQAQWIREKKEWHAGEERDDLPDGGLLLRMKVGGLEAVKRFVMQYGAHAKVRGPAILRQMIEEELRQMLQDYDPRPPSVADG
jgi:predicted DNA-binding transcriptional regulator YafY